MNISLNIFIKSILAVFVVMCVFPACEQSPPLSSESSENTSESVQILKSNSKQQLSKLNFQSNLIDADGGTIVIGDSWNSYSFLQFPEDAIDEDDYPNGVYVRVYQTKGFVQIDCYPEGIQFDEPVTIQLSYANAFVSEVDENKLDIYYFNPLNNQYESTNGVVNTVENFVTSTITHFSRYAIGYE